MRKYFTKERVLLIVALLFVVLSLTGCSSESMYKAPLNKFTDETNIFGWLLLWPIGWLMHAIGTLFPAGSGQFAIGLVITTLIIRTIAWPIYAKTNDMSLKMTVAQPELQSLQNKYANRTDPEAKQRMQQEMMAIYKKYNINPLGCLMPFLQMPIFMAMYTVVRRIVVPGGLLTITDTSLFGIKDCLDYGIYGATNTAKLWSGAFWVGIVLALLVGGSMWLLNFLSQRKPKYAKNIPGQKDNPMNKQMMIMNYFMIFTMVIVSLSNNGLALYWVIGNLYAVAQNVISRKLNEKKYEKMKTDVDRLISK